MTLKIKKVKTTKGERYLVTGITKKTKLNTIARRYSKRYQLPAFLSDSLSRGRILLFKRKKPLNRTLTWNEWEKI